MMSTEARLLEGKVIAAKIQEEIKQAINEAKNALGNNFKAPKLVSIQAYHDPSADWYVGQQEKLALKLGIEFEKRSFTQPPDQSELLHLVRDVSHSNADGIFIAMPLPAGYNADEVLLALDPKKDVEGIHPTSLGFIVLRKSKLIPPTAYASLKLIEWAVSESKKDLRGMKAVIVGQSAIVGRPLQMLLGERRVTTVVCNTGTSAADLQKFVGESDIVIGCAGQPSLIKGSWIREGAIVIDVGTTEVNGKLAGDVEFEEAKKHASFITPVPGGVGPLTVTMLMKNLIHAYKWQRGI